MKAAVVYVINCDYAKIESPIMSPPFTPLYLKRVVNDMGLECDIVDVRFYLNDDLTVNNDAVITRLTEVGYDLCLFSFFTENVYDAVTIASGVKQALPDVVTIAGGPHITAVPQSDSCNGVFDYAVVGGARGGLADIFEAYRVNQRTKVVRSDVDLSFCNIVDLDIYSDIYKNFDIKTANLFMNPFCSKQCAFCASGGCTTSVKYSEVALDDFIRSACDLRDKYGVTYLALNDPIATLKTKKLVSLLDFIRSDGHFSIQFNSSTDSFKIDIAKACHGLECGIWFGVESINRSTQAIINKIQPDYDIQMVSELSQEYGLRSHFNIIIGLPEQGEAEYEELLAFKHKHSHIVFNPNIFKPLPGTPLYERYSDMGIIIEEKIFSTDKESLKNVDYEMVQKYYTKIYG